MEVPGTATPGFINGKLIERSSDKAQPEAA